MIPLIIEGEPHDFPHEWTGSAAIAQLGYGDPT